MKIEQASMDETTDVPQDEPGQETEQQKDELLDPDDLDSESVIEYIYQLWWRWGDFHLFVITPTIDVITPPLVIPPEPLDNSDELEFVYPIRDHGYKLSTSKGTELYSAGMSMCKLYYTIEKMVFMLIERLQTGGVSAETEVQVAFAGHELAQRKCFELIINLPNNVVVTNFDPGSWGEQYLQMVKRLADKGYGYLPPAPRKTYRQSHTPQGLTKR